MSGNEFHQLEARWQKNFWVKLKWYQMGLAKCGQVRKEKHDWLPNLISGLSWIPLVE